MEDKALRQIKSQYFEGILQLKNYDDEIIKFVIAQVSKVNDKGVFITNEKVRKNLVEYYITRKNFMHTLAKKLKKEFGGIVKKSENLHSFDKQESKNLYRLTVLVEFPELKKNDVFVFQGDLYKVTSLGKKITVLKIDKNNTNKNRKTSFFYKDIKKSGDFEILRKYDAELSRTKPYIEIIHPETYQSMKVKNREKMEKIPKNNKINVVFYGDEAYSVD